MGSFHKRDCEENTLMKTGLHAWATTAGWIGPFPIPIHISTDDATIIAKTKIVTWSNLLEKLDSYYRKFPKRIKRLFRSCFFTRITIFWRLPIRANLKVQHLRCLLVCALVLFTLSSRASWGLYSSSSSSFDWWQRSTLKTIKSKWGRLWRSGETVNFI